MHTTQNMEWINLEEATIPNFYIDHMITYFVTRLADDGSPIKIIRTHALMPSPSLKLVIFNWYLYLLMMISILDVWAYLK